MGWLSATPEGQDETRLQMFGESLPELPVTETLHLTWIELGCVKPGLSGPVAIEWTELQAFAQMTGMSLKPAEAQCLINMSRAYVSGFADKSPLSIPPMERKHD